MTISSVERLIASAQELLWERGYVGTSPKALLERAGVGQGSMYHHFAGKADLAASAIERSATELRDQSDASLSGTAPPIARLRRYLLARREVLRGCRIGRLAYDPEVVADPALRAPLEATFNWLLRRSGEVVAEAQQAGELPAELDVHAIAAAIVAVVQGGYVVATSHPVTQGVHRGSPRAPSAPRPRRSQRVPDKSALGGSRDASGHDGGGAVRWLGPRFVSTDHEGLDPAS